MKKIYGLILVLFAVSFTYGADEGIMRIKEQCISYLILDMDDGKIAKDIKTQNLDGSWEGINYSSQSRGYWEPRLHLTRLERIARAFAHKDSTYYRSKEALDCIVRGLNFWASRDPQSPNWWHQSIGTPSIICNILILLNDSMTAELLENLKPVLLRSSPGMTGQNKVWLAGIHLQKGILFKRPEWVQEGRNLIVSELHIAAPGAEGIQSDFSFHQHGAQLQFGNYGLAYFADMTKWAFILNGTRFAFSKNQMALLGSYYRDGLRWVLFDDQMDFSACGRQNHNTQDKYKETVKNARLFFQILDQGNTLTDKDFYFSGSRYFYDSDFYVQRSSEAYFSVKMCSKRTIGSETVNSENILARLTGHGATILMSSKRELDGIGALWDWRKIPGVTALQDESSLFCKDPGFSNKSEWVGGLSDGETGFCAMDFDNGELTAKKSYFFFGASLLCMGSRISSSKNAPVYTIVAQHRAGKKIEQTDSSSIANGSFSYKITSAPSSKILSGIQHVSGNWKKINPALSAKAPDDDMFFIYINHGTQVQNQTYVYSVDLLDAAAPPDYKLLTASSDAIHAVANGKDLMIAFFEPGSVKLSDGKTIVSKSAILLMLRGDKCYASDPGQKLRTADITIDKKNYKIEFPSGQLAGSTVKVF